MSQSTREQLTSVQEVLAHQIAGCVFATRPLFDGRAEGATQEEAAKNSQRYFRQIAERVVDLLRDCGGGLHDLHSVLGDAICVLEERALSEKSMPH